MDEIIIEKQKGELTEVVLELNQNTLITELKNLEVTPTSQEQTFKAGVGAFKEVKIKGDENLISENIKSGETIFGVEGNKNVVDTSDATATSSKIHPDCDAYVKGKKIKGGMTIWDNTKPRCTPTHQTIINPENPFILTRQQTTGERYEEIIKIPANVIDPAWLEGKNICIRANYNPNLTYWSKDWRIEIATVNDGSKFFFKVYSGGYMEIWARNAANKTTNYTLYTANVDSIDELTIDSWKKKEVVADGYTNGDLGPIGTLYAYGRDDCGKTTGLTGSSGVPGSRNKFILKSANSKTGYTEANAEFYSEITHDNIAKKIKLKSEDIREGAIYLGVNGTAPDNDAKIDATGLTTFTVAGALKSIDKMTVPETCTNFSKGFQNCANLTSIPDLSHIPLTNVTYMFDGCSNLENPPALNTSQATSGDYMFRNCKKMKNAPQIDTSRMASYNYMYNGCSSLENIPNHNWSGARNIQYVFQNCTSLKNVDFRTTYGSCMAYSLFSGCTSLETAKLSISPYNMSSIFANCTSLESVELHSGSGGTFYSENAQNTFQNCTNLKTIVSPLNLAVPNGSGASNSYFSYLFDGCTSLEDTSNLNFSRGTYGPGWSCDYMFRNCTSLKNLPASLEAMTGPFCSQMRYVFQGCTGLEKVNHLALSYLCSNIFYGCSNLTTANITFTTGSSGQTQNVFTNCSSLKNVTGTMTSSNNHADLSNWFQNCTAMETTPDIFETYTGTAALQNTFWGCTSLKTVRQGWANIVGNIIKNCFNGCINLVTVPEFDGSKINSAQKEYWEFAFTGCDSLSDESLNNIMASMTKYKGTMNTRTMSQLGFNTNQIERCKNLSNYQAFINAGWQAK